MKRCSKCRATRPLSSFYPNPRYKDGLHCWCKACLRAYKRTHPENPVKCRLRQRRWRARHRDRIRAEAAQEKEMQRKAEEAARAEEKSRRQREWEDILNKHGDEFPSLRKYTLE